MAVFPQTMSATRGDDSVLLFIYIQTAAASGNVTHTRIASCVPHNNFHGKYLQGDFRVARSEAFKFSRSNFQRAQPYEAPQRDTRLTT